MVKRWQHACVPRQLADEPCVFCAIIRGEQAAQIVLDEPHVLGFLDSHPLFLGHVLLVPKQHVLTLSDLPDAGIPAYFRTVQRTVRAVETAMASDGSLVLNNNIISQSVPHLHVHVIPRNRGDGLRFWLGPRRKYADEADAVAHAACIAKAYAALG
jgi:histidine triad (HIT) family protein